MASVIFLADRVNHFHARSSEWFLATFMLGWGIVLFYPGATLADPSYSAFAQTEAGEMATGAFVMLLGAGWCWGLWFNGRKEPATSTVRAACAFGGGVVFAMISVAFMAAFAADGILNHGIWTFLCLSLFSFYNLSCIAQYKGALAHGCKP